MDYPILIEGQEAGRLSVRQEGLYTVFEASLPPRPGLTRLWVAGEGRSVYLGLMEPGAEGLRLCRRLSAAAMRDFPPTIAYAAIEEPVFRPVQPSAAPEEAEEAEAEPEKPPPLPAVPPPAQPGEGLTWFSRPDGSLTAFDGYSGLLALPARLRRRGPGLRLVWIDGREYMVFRY